MSTLKSRLYDILAHQHKLGPTPPIGSLTPEQSSVLTALTLAAEQFQLDTAMEIAEASFDGIALTLLSVYNNGIPEGAQMQSENLQKVAEILAKAGENDRKEQGDTTGADVDARERGAADTAGSAKE